MQIIEYLPEYARYFETFNKAWLEKYFVVEPVDEWVLTHPEEAILAAGGAILFAENEGQVVGTVALQYVEPAVFELTKMAVGEHFHGKGMGKQLCAAAISKGRDLGAKKLILYTNSVLQNAIHIYHTLGFKDLPLQKGKYKRADVMMELLF